MEIPYCSADTRLK